MRANLLMASLFLLISLWLFNGTATADEIVNYVKVECDAESDLIKIEYDQEERIIPKPPNLINPDDLVEYTEDEKFSGMKTAIKSCKLSDGLYNVTIGPRPDNTNPQGQCGAYISAWAEISHNSSKWGPYEFEDLECNSNNLVIEKIIVHGANEGVFITTTTKESPKEIK